MDNTNRLAELEAERDEWARGLKARQAHVRKLSQINYDRCCEEIAALAAQPTPPAEVPHAD